MDRTNELLYSLRRNVLRPATLVACGLPLLSIPAAAQIVIVDGDDLAAAVDAAPDGETIIIQSDATFVGTLDWTGRELTIRGGFGYFPTIRGDLDQPAIDLGVQGTTGILRDVRIEAGVESTPSSLLDPLAITLGGTGSVAVLGSLDLFDCQVVGRTSLSGTGHIDYDVTAERSKFSALVNLGGTGDAQIDLRRRDDCVIVDLSVNPSGDAIVSLHLRDSEVLEGVRFSAISDAQVTGSVRRCTIHDGLSVSESTSDGSTAMTDVLVESSLLIGEGIGTGLFSDATSTLRGVNLTVTGFAVGLETGVDSTFENLALFGNADDLMPVVLPTAISNSLIEDGTYTQFSGNFGGTPIVDASYALIEGSIGIDAGNSGALDLGLLDLNGDPRVQDGDADGAATVSVGAIETVAPCAQASFTYFNGSGVNPTGMTLAGPPALGGPLVIDIPSGPTTVVTGVAIGVRAPAPYQLPGFDGELLVSLAPFPLLDLQVPGAPHVLALPDDPALCGVQVDIQGFRVDAAGIQLLNGASLTLGQ